MVVEEEEGKEEEKERWMEGTIEYGLGRACVCIACVITLDALHFVSLCITIL